MEPARTEVEQVCDHLAMQFRRRDMFALAISVYSLVGCSDDGSAIAAEPNVTLTTPAPEASVVTTTAIDSSEPCADAARSTAMEAISSFDGGDIDAVSALVAPAPQFRFVSVGSGGAVYDRGRVATKLLEVFGVGERVVRAASFASDSAALQIRVFAPEYDPAGFLVVGISVLYHDGGAVKFQIACPGRSIIGISWDSVAVVS